MDCCVRWTVGSVPVRGVVAGVWGCASEAVGVVPSRGVAGAPSRAGVAVGGGVVAVRWTGVGPGFDAVLVRCDVRLCGWAGEGVAGLGVCVGLVGVARCTTGPAEVPVVGAVGLVPWVGVMAGLGADAGALFDAVRGWCDAGAVVARWEDAGRVSDAVRG